jgi:hypothetical protein
MKRKFDPYDLPNRLARCWFGTYLPSLSRARQRAVLALAHQLRTPQRHR